MPKILESDEAPITSGFKQKIEKVRATPPEKQREIARKLGLII